MIEAKSRFTNPEFRGAKKSYGEQSEKCVRARARPPPPPPAGTQDGNAAAVAQSVERAVSLRLQGDAPKKMLLLFETPAGYSLFKVKDEGKLEDAEVRVDARAQFTRF
jgi:hypothetical protein